MLRSGRARRLLLTAGAGLLAGASFAPVPALADSVTVRVGDSRICGAVRSESNGTIEVETPMGAIRFPASAVEARTSGACGETANADDPAPVADSGAGADDVPLRIVGSNTIGGTLMPDIVENYLDANKLKHTDWEEGAEGGRLLVGRPDSGPGLAVTVVAKGSGEAFKALAAKGADIGMSSRPANDKDVAAVREATGVDLTATENEHVLGLDGLAIIVNKDNPVGALTLEQIADIFSGTITNWSQVGGADAEISLFARDDASGTFSTFRDLVLGKRSLNAEAERFDSNTSLSNAVSSEPNGIGFTSLASVRGAKALEIASNCGISYVPNEFNVRTEDYTLARRLFLYTAGTEEKTVQLVDFALSPAAGPSLVDDGFVALDPVVGSPDYTASRLLGVWRSAPGAPSDRYNEVLLGYGMTVRNAVRLSTTFRFLRASSDLDSRGVRDIDRVVAFAASPEGQSKTFSFIGFTDEDGGITQNIRLAKERATGIAETVRKAAAAKGVKLDVGKVLGAGPVAPVTCNTTDEEKVKNRRVEIWLTEKD